MRTPDYSRWRRGLLIAALGPAAAACERAPDLQLPAHFVLASTSAGKLPTAVQRDSACVIMLAAGSMVLNDARTFSSDFQMSRACPDGIMPIPSPGTRGTYHFAGDSIFFRNAQGNPAGRGVLEGDSLIVRGSTHTLVYRHRTE